MLSMCGWDVLQVTTLFLVVGRWSGGCWQEMILQRLRENDERFTKIESQLGSLSQGYARRAPTSEGTGKGKADGFEATLADAPWV